MLVLCGLLFFFVSACEVRGAEVDGDDGGTVPSAGEGDLKEEDEKVDPQAFLTQIFGLQSEEDGSTDHSLARFNRVSDDIEKEWKTYALATAGAAGAGGLGALVSHLAKLKVDSAFQGKDESERTEILLSNPGIKKKSAVAGAARAVTGAIAAAGLLASAFAVARLLLAKQERRRTQTLFEHRRGELLKGLLSKIKEEEDSTPKEEGGDDGNA